MDPDPDLDPEWDPNWIKILDQCIWIHNTASYPVRTSRLLLDCPASSLHCHIKSVKNKQLRVKNARWGWEVLGGGGEEEMTVVDILLYSWETKGLAMASIPSTGHINTTAVPL